jgi:recombination protein RecT
MSATALQAPEKQYTLDQWLSSDKLKRPLENIIGNKEGVTRFCQIALSTAKRQPKLAECHVNSVLECLMKLAQVNLPPDAYHAHLVPFWNNKAKPPRLEAQLIIDYKGLVTVIRRNPQITVVKGGVVYQKDGFTYIEGSARVFEHRPSYALPGKDNAILGAYSFVKLADGDWEVDFLPTWKIELARARSRARDSGPWVSDYDEMCMKTALRHHSKTLPLLPEEREAVTLDDDQFETFNPFVGKLEHRKPEFRDETRPLHDVDRGSSTTTERTGQVHGESRSARPEGGNGPSGGDNLEGTETGGETSDDPGATQPGDNQPPPDPAGAAPEPPKQVVSKSLQKLLAACEKDGVSQHDVISVLMEHEIEVGKAADTNYLADLPDEAVRMAITQWATVLFGVKRLEQRFEQPD